MFKTFVNVVRQCRPKQFHKIDPSILDSSPQSLKVLRNSSEFMPFIIFLAAPGLDEMRHIYDNLRVTNSMIASSKNLASFERNSSIRYSSRRARCSFRSFKCRMTKC
jgi:hypothetical protein